MDRRRNTIVAVKPENVPIKRKKKDCKLVEGAEAKHVKLGIENFHGSYKG